MLAEEGWAGKAGQKDLVVYVDLRWGFVNRGVGKH